MAIHDRSPCRVHAPHTHCAQVGYAGEDLPRSTFPCVVDHPVSETIYHHLNYRKPAPPTYADQNCSSDGDGAPSPHPISRGRVVDWEKMERVVEYAVGIGVDNTEAGTGGCPVLLTEMPLARDKDRERFTQLLLEGLGAPSVLAANSGVLSVMASGRTRGLALECGGGVTSAVPVFEGFALNHATLRLDLGGQDLTAAILAAIRSDPTAIQVRRTAPAAIQFPRVFFSVFVCRAGGQLARHPRRVAADDWRAALPRCRFANLLSHSLSHSCFPPLSARRPSDNTI